MLRSCERDISLSLGIFAHCTGIQRFVLTGRLVAAARGMSQASVYIKNSAEEVGAYQTLHSCDRDISLSSGLYQQLAALLLLAGRKRQRMECLHRWVSITPCREDGVI